MPIKACRVRQSKQRKAAANRQAAATAVYYYIYYRRRQGTAFHKPVGTALAAVRFQNSDCRGQRSEAVQAYSVETVCLQNLSAAKTIKILLNPVGAGLKCPPAGKSDFVICYGVKQNYGFSYRHKLFYYRTLLGRAQRPAPTTTEFIFPAQPRLRANFPIPHLISNV